MRSIVLLMLEIRCPKFNICITQCGSYSYIIFYFLFFFFPPNFPHWTWKGGSRETAPLLDNFQENHAKNAKSRKYFKLYICAILITD